MRQQILEVLISSSVLILALALLRILLRGKISPRLQFALWLLVAVRLLVPVSIGQSAASVMNYVPEQQMSEILEDASIPAQVPQQVTALPVEGAAFTDEVLPAEASQTATEAPTVKPEKRVMKSMTSRFASLAIKALCETPGLRYAVVMEPTTVAAAIAG